MSEGIPDDIMKAVQTAWEKAWSKAGSTNADSIREAIAMGILAERERCVNVALTEYEKRFENVAGYPAARVHDFIVVARAIEKRIRDGWTAAPKAEG